MTDNAIAISNKLEMTYGSRDDVREITDRLMALHPQAKEVGIPGMRAVAQMAIMAGANPLPTAGEIYVWTDFTGRVSTDLGIAYFRRIAAQKDTTMWANGDEPRPMTEQEREQYNIPEGAVAGICKGFLLSEYTQLLDRGVPWQAAMDMLARTSTAVVAKDEMFFADTDYNRKKNRVGKPSPPPSGRTWQWVAEKRAEKGFYRMKALVDTTLTDAIQAQAKQVLATVEHGNGRWITDNDAPDMTLDEFNGAAFDDYNQDIVTDGDFVEVESGKPGRHLDILERLQTAVHPNKTTDATEKQLKLLHSGISQIFDNDKDKKAVLSAIFPEIEAEDGSISTKSLTVGQASVIIDWLDATQKNQYKVSDAARTEAFIILNAVRQDEGQLGLFDMVQS